MRFEPYNNNNNHLKHLTQVLELAVKHEATLLDQTGAKGPGQTRDEHTLEDVVLEGLFGRLERGQDAVEHEAELRDQVEARQRNDLLEFFTLLAV